MPEVIKRMNSGWVMMDSYTSTNGNQLFFLSRAECNCVIEIKPNGYGFVHSTSGSKRI